MNIAVTTWQRRVSPVCDVASQLMLVAVLDGREESRATVTLTADSLWQRAGELKDMGAEVLICGAISRCMHAVLSAMEIEVIPFVCGDVDQVLQAYVDGTLEPGQFKMPGCGRRRGRGCCRRQ